MDPLTASGVLPDNPPLPGQVGDDKGTRTLPESGRPGDAPRTIPGRQADDKGWQAVKPGSKKDVCENSADSADPRKQQKQQTPTRIISVGQHNVGGFPSPVSTPKGLGGGGPNWFYARGGPWLGSATPSGTPSRKGRWVDGAELKKQDMPANTAIGRPSAIGSTREESGVETRKNCVCIVFTWSGSLGSVGGLEGVIPLRSVGLSSRS